MTVSSRGECGGLGPNAGQPVPRRWHNLSWWDTLVTIHLTVHNGGNPFAHQWLETDFKRDALGLFKTRTHSVFILLESRE